MTHDQTSRDAPSAATDESVAHVDKESGDWVVGTANGEQLEQVAHGIVTWDGRGAIGKQLHFVFDQKIFVGDETEFGYTPTADNAYRGRRLKRAHALPPPPDELGYTYSLTVDGDPAEPPPGVAPGGARPRPRVRVRDVEVLPEIPEETSLSTPPSLDNHARATHVGFWKVSNLQNQRHLEKNPAVKTAVWHSRDNEDLRLRFDFDPPIFEDYNGTDPNDMVFSLASGDPPLALEFLEGVTPGDYCYDLEIMDTASERWVPVWGPPVDNKGCDGGGTSGIYNIPSRPGVRPRVRVVGVEIKP